MLTFKLLTVRNPKIAKGTKLDYLTAALHLAPANLSGYQVCPMATKGCIAACLNTAGHGGIALGKGRLTVEEIASGTRTNTIQKARIRRTLLYFDNRAAFMTLLVADIAKLCRMAKVHGLQPSIRLNGTSDIPWERVPVPACHGAPDVANIMARFPQVQFYDYTKRPNRRDLPANYSLTFSLAVGNDDAANAALNNGMNVAVVFHHVPEAFELVGLSVPVIDGDEHDLRFLDPRGVIVGLKAKGNAKSDTSGFVR